MENFLLWIKSNAILKKKTDRCYCLSFSRFDKGWRPRNRAGCFLHVWVVWNPVGKIYFGKVVWCVHFIQLCFTLVFSWTDKWLANDIRQNLQGEVRSYCTNWYHIAPTHCFPGKHSLCLRSSQLQHCYCYLLKIFAFATEVLHNFIILLACIFFVLFFSYMHVVFYFC